MDFLEMLDVLDQVLETCPSCGKELTDYESIQELCESCGEDWS